MEEQLEISTIEFEDFSGNQTPKKEINFQEDVLQLADIRLEVTAELGTRTATVGEVSSYQVGDYIEVTRMAGHTVDVYVGQVKIAIGEIILMDEDNFGLRITEVTSKNGEFLKNVHRNGEIE